MYAMSNVDAEKYKQLSESLNSALANDVSTSRGGGSDIDSSSGTSIEVQAPAKGKIDNGDPELVAATEELQYILEEKGLNEEVSVSIRERGIVVSLTNTILFEPGSAYILPEGRNTLIEIGKIAREVDHYIRVEGNTDDVPINTPKFPSNWELSVIRATEVLKLLISESGVPPDKISAIGYGEYRPAKPNTSAENRAQNRKVDIVILSNKYIESESAQYSEE